MNTKFYSLIAASILPAFGYTQFNHSGTTGDMRNFASQTSIVMERNQFRKQKPNTVGSQFLFNDWAAGMITNKEGFSYSEGLFNYDKIHRLLYIYKNDTIYLVNKFQVQTVRMRDLADSNNRCVLEKIPSLRSDDLYIVVAKGNKYSLMKEVSTKFIAANFQTNGIVSSGNNYDEFKDEYKYYIIFPDKSARPVSLKKKSIRNVMENEKEKLEAFYKANPEAEENEEFLVHFITSLDQ